MAGQSLHTNPTPKDIEQEQTQPSYTYSALGFWLRWVLANAIGWTVVIVVLWGVGWLLWAILWGVCGFVGYATVGALSGVLVGALQRVVLRRQAYQIDCWILATAVGWYVGEAIVGTLKWLVTIRGTCGVVDGATSGAITGIALGASIGIAQSFILKKHVNRAERWVLVNVVGWMVGSALGWAAANASIWFVGGFIGEAIAGAIIGILTGIPLVWLLFDQQLSTGWKPRWRAWTVFELATLGIAITLVGLLLLPKLPLYWQDWSYCQP